MARQLDAWRLRVPGIAAHRGGRSVGPENTIIGILAGLSAGATHIEVDVRGTADDVPVIMHDETAERTCLEDVEIEDATLEEVKRLDPCALWSQHAGIATGEHDPPNGHHRSWYEVPTLSEILATFPGVPLILDLKETAPAEPIAEVLKHGWRRPEDIIVGGFDDDVIDALVEHLPDLPRTPGREGTEAFYSGQEVDVDAIIVPTEHEGIELVDPGIIELAHEQGKAFWVWTVNEADVARELMDLGVDGIITDEPGKMSDERIRRMG